MIIDKVRFPIGPFTPILSPSIDQRNKFIQQIPKLIPYTLSMLVNLKPEQLQIPYRRDGWTIQQIIHHMADNDMNAYLRFKRALTEEEPSLPSYREDLWAELPDYLDVPIDTSLKLLEALHSRFFILLQQLTPEHYDRTLRTQVLGVINLDTAVQRFIWHNQHHMSQITSLIKNNGW